MSHTFSANEQYFSLTTNQDSTFSLGFSTKRTGRRCICETRTPCCQSTRMSYLQPSSEMLMPTWTCSAFARSSMSLPPCLVPSQVLFFSLQIDALSVLYKEPLPYLKLPTLEISCLMHHLCFFCELHKYRHRRSTRTHTHSREHMYANLTSMSTSEIMC
jgi:hypothetical protein